jgi:hypothetical protein
MLAIFLTFPIANAAPIDDYDQFGHLMCYHPLHPFHCLKHLHHMIPHRHLDIKYEQHTDIKTYNFINMPFMMSKIKPFQTNSLHLFVGVLIGLCVSNKHYINFEIVF